MAEKLFIEIDEEIIFVVEKIKKVEGDKVILVVPDRAALLGSVVSLKLLAQEISKTDKLAILVSQDEVGSKLAKKAKLVVVDKPGDVSKEVWDKALKYKKEISSMREQEKKKLIDERKEEPVPISDKEDESKTEEVKRPVSDLKKLEPQKVDVGGFEMVAGGDIAEMGGESVEEDKTKDVSTKDEGYKMDAEEKSAKVEEKEAPKMEKVKQSRQVRSGLVGQDLSSFSYTSMPKKAGAKKGKGIDIGGYFNKWIESIKTFFAAGGSRQKILIGAGVALVVFFALAYFVFPRGRVVIKVESRDIGLSEEVVADTSTSTLDVEALTIPAQMIEAVKDRSGSATATGRKETGEVASGQVTIFNLTESEVTVTSGTVLESIETGLKYKTTTDVTVPAKKPDDAEITPGLIGNEDVGLIAETFGDDYNVSKKMEFRVQGFDVENLYGKNFGNITGGTTEEKTVVSQKDFDGLKTSLEEQLQQDLLESLGTEAGSSKELLEDTINYEVINEDPTPAVGAEADTLNLSITMKATALSFDKEDIDRLAEVLVEEENDLSVEIEEFEYSSEVLRTEGDKIYIDLSITGVVTPSINQDDMKSNLANKSRKAAEEYLNSQEEIKESSIELRPTWLPGFLRHFPSSTNRIEVEIEKV